MLTTATTIHLPGLISPTRTPWTGTIREALGDIEEERLVSLCETAGITITNEGDGVLDDDEMLAEARSQVTAARATLTEHVRAALDENTISKSAAARAAGISRPLLDSWLKR